MAMMIQWLNKVMSLRLNLMMILYIELNLTLKRQILRLNSFRPFSFSCSNYLFYSSPLSLLMG